MVNRKDILHHIRQALRRSRVVAVMGPRQSGKTTLARHLVDPGSINYFDLEDSESDRRLFEPMTALKNLRGLVVIDEVQKRPELFPLLRVLADRKPLPARFLILGSASPALMRHCSESLAGRLETIDIGGFSLQEIGFRFEEKLWLRGGQPLSFLARSDKESFLWRKNFIKTVLERDIPQLGFGITSSTMLRFWSMLANYHGQVWSAAEPARSLGIGETTVRRYLELLQGIFMVRILLPWHENLGKRQVKAPKIYFRDTGILHQLMGIATSRDLLCHARMGASWEGFVAEQILAAKNPDEAYFWRIHSGAEIDLLLIHRGKRVGIEIKRADAPALTPSMETAVRDLKLDKLYLIYPGERSYPVRPKITVMGFRQFIQAPLHL